MTVRAQRREAQIAAEAVSTAIEILPAKGASKLTIDLKVTATGALFRIAPVRDPQEPRFWCVAVRKCVTGGMVDASEPTWVDRPGHPWAELGGMIDAIRDDVCGWLDTTDRRALRVWLLTAAPTPPTLTITPAAGNAAR